MNAMGVLKSGAGSGWLILTLGLKFVKAAGLPQRIWLPMVEKSRGYALGVSTRISVKNLLLTCFTSFAVFGTPLHAFGASGRGNEPSAVDVMLVLATDVSGSITEEKYEIQRKGIAEALINPRVIDAILSGAHKKVAMTYVEWQGLRSQKVQVPWTVISSLDDAKLFASEINKVERLNFISKADRKLYRNELPAIHGDNTSIYGAITFCKALIQRAELSADLKILDISSDGENNEGPEPDLARDMAIADGISINGLVIINEFPDLEAYFRIHVVGGDSSFTVHIQDIEGMAGGLSAKLIREIANRSIEPTVESASLDTIGFE